MMKVCIIYYTFYQFNPTFIREAESLVERGDEVDVICLRTDKDKLFERVKKVNVHRIMERRFDEKGPFQYLCRLLRFFILCILLVTKLHRKKRYNVIHVTSPPDFMVFTCIIPKLLGAKVILDIHDIVPEFYQRKFFVTNSHPLVVCLKFIEKLSTAFADHVFTVTEIWKNKLSERSVTESKCSVLLNTPDRNLFYKKNTGRDSVQSEFRLLYHGALREHFGVETAVRAMERITKEIPKVRLDIYGIGHQRDYLCQIAKEMRLSKWIKINDPVPFDAVPDIIGQCDVGIVPTRDGVFAGEALSVKSLEYIAIQVPIVISRTLVSQYYYDDSMVMFFEPGNPNDLARAVIELYSNPDKIKELVRNEGKFNKKHNWEHYKKIYHGVIDNLCSNPDSK